MSKKNRSPWRKSNQTAPTTPAPTEPRATSAQGDRCPSCASGKASGFPRFSPTSDPAVDPVVDLSPISPAQLAANRANAQLSTGPRTESGRQKSSRNAVKSALTGRTILLPTDDVEEYENFLAAWKDDLQPEGPIETELVQIIVDSHWRLRRIQELEYALYDHGNSQFEEMFADLPKATRNSKIMLQTHLTYQKEFRNLHIQESRIDRKRAKALKELEQLQASRQSSEQDPIAAAQDEAFPNFADELAAFEAGYIPPSIAENYAKLCAAEKNGFDFPKQRMNANPAPAVDGKEAA